MKRLEIHSVEKGYLDPCDLMIHAMFQILVDYVEKENPFKYIDWDYDEQHKHSASEIKSLYKWWKERLVRKDPYEDVPDRPMEDMFKKISENLVQFVPCEDPEYLEALDKAGELEEQYDREDKENMHRLVEIYGCLWT